MPGSPGTGGSASGRSISAMLTRVATASAADGGSPTMCRPQGSRRDSISISFAYTLPTTPSRSSRVSAAAASSVSGRDTSRSRLHWRAVSMMVAQMAGPRPPSRRPWYDEISSFSSFSPLYRPAFSAGGVRYEMVLA